MRAISESTTKALGLVKDYMRQGLSFTKACKTANINPGLAYYHLKGVIEIPKREPKKDKHSSHILNADRANDATFFIDTCFPKKSSLRSGHDFRGSGVYLMGIATKDYGAKRAVAVAVALGSPTALELSRFLRQASHLIPKGSVIMGDLGNEFCGEFADTCLALGFTLVRIRGWQAESTIQGGKGVKPWIESLWGQFEKTYFRPVLGEYLSPKGLPTSSLPLEEVFRACSQGLKDLWPHAILCESVPSIAQAKPLEIEVRA